MTLIEFIKSQVSQDTPLGSLAEDVIRDKDFPFERSEEGIISYLEFRTRQGGNSEIFNDMMTAYLQQKDNPVDPIDLDINFTPLKAEHWKFLKTHFRSDRVITVGESGDIYKVFTVDSASQKAIKFEIYGRQKLTELSILNLEDIYLGDLSREVSVQEAIDLLSKNQFGASRKPTEPNYTEMIEYLTSQKNNLL